VGGVAAAFSNDTAVNVGVMGAADNSARVNVGVFGVSGEENDENSDSLMNAGIAGLCGGSPFQNHGGYFVITDTIGTNYAISARVKHSDTSDYAAYLDGKVVHTGPLLFASDRKLKTGIADIDNAVQLLAQLEPKKFEYRQNEYPISLPRGTQYGLIADEVEKVLPQLVSTVTHPEYRDMKGHTLGASLQYQAVNYEGFIPLLIDAVKKQQAAIDEQKTLLETLNRKIKSLESR
jgi:flagellar biosynthesis chaperone FliJ